MSLIVAVLLGVSAALLFESVRWSITEGTFIGPFRIIRMVVQEIRYQRSLRRRP